MSDHEKPCPFCGSTNLKSGGDDKIVGTWCLDCEAIGPNQYGRHEWNDRADRIEELEERLKAATDDAKEAEAYVEKLEANLAKAVEVLGEAIYLLDPDEEDIAKETGLYRIVTTYAELTGGKDE